MKIISWQNVLNSNLKMHYQQGVVRDHAIAAGYPYYSWNGRVYNLDGEEVCLTDAIDDGEVQDNSDEKVMRSLVALKVEAEAIHARHAEEVKAFYVKLEALTSTSEFYQYGVDNSMSYRGEPGANPLWDIQEMFSNHDRAYWMPSSWEHC